MNKVIFLNSFNSKDDTYAVLYLEQKAGYSSCMLNIFGAEQDSEFCLVLTDRVGNTHFENFTDETWMFRVNADFDPSGEVLGELFINGSLVSVITSQNKTLPIT